MYSQESGFCYADPKICRNSQLENFAFKKVKVKEEMIEKTNQRILMLRDAQQEDSRGEREEPADWLPGNKLRCCVRGSGFSQGSLTMSLCFYIFTRSFTFSSAHFWTFFVACFPPSM